MTFDAIEYINTPRWLTSRLGLDRTRELLDRLGRPQDSLRFVHVAGTNGKGSTCAFLSSILVTSGYRTGLFTSPYIETFYERIRVNGANITDDELTWATLRVRDAAEAMEAEGGEHPTEFELMTTVALVHFARVKCDIVVLEVGLGGRLDSTNVIDAPEVAVIAPIALDHTNLLGTTLAEIAHEKAGIVKPGSTVVSWPQEPSAMEVVSEAARCAGDTLVVPDFSLLSVGKVAGSTWGATLERAEQAPRAQELQAGVEGDAYRDPMPQVEVPMRRFSYRGRDYRTRLLGSYQPSNAAMAIEAAGALRARGWKIPDEAVASGIAQTRWPARFEVLPQPAGAPRVVVDGGHNPQGAGVLATSLRDVFPGERPVFLIGVLADKDYRHMLDRVVSLGCAFVCVAPPNPRALSASDLAQAIGEIAGPENKPPIVVASDFPDAVQRARELAGADGLICAFGSLYSIGGVKAAFAEA